MFCRHPRLLTLPRDLFEGLATFRELERRIVALPEELQRGDALEVLVEAYLQTHPLFQVDQLWLVGQVPREVRKSLNLPSGQKSIDGVFKTRSGELVPYQVKFRTGRPQVTVREVSTFLGLTERAKDRMLISNSDRYASDIENRDHLRILTGTYFDSLTRDELAAITCWLKGRPARPAPTTPLAHQRRAIKDITAALTAENRATAVMACGTGKTLVGLRVAESMESQTVLVLVPSLALLSQALADWSRDTVWGERFEYLCVCSDPSVSEAADQWTLRLTEAPFPVQTQPKVVRDFLSRSARGKVRVVFSTYQSAPIVAKGMPRGQAFDVAIFDEAHKTAGPHRGTFAFALEDGRLRVRKRLFLTATPRRIDVRHKDRQGDFRFVSMEDATVYGRRAHELSFAEAVAQGIICDYRVVVATVDPKEIPAAAIKHGITLVKGDQHATRWVATQIAVARAIQETGARKVITFHSRVEQAKHFASDTPKGIQSFLSGFSVGHISGADPVAVRKEVLAGFKEDRKQLVANARCLTEGVDLPAVDMVVFSSPRKSKVDIIQAIGRAMRKPRGGEKTVGYVVVPILLAPDKANDLEAACRKTEWEDIVDVLAALRDHDCRLEEIIQRQQVALGKGEVFDSRVFTERVHVIGPAVAVDALQRHIGTIVLERLGETWDLRFGELLAFKAREGNCDVPQEYSLNPSLGFWLNVQRRSYSKGSLASERVARLEEIGVVWNTFDTAWANQYRALLAFKAQHGHCRVPQQCSSDLTLGRWLNKQRSTRRKGKLEEDRFIALESLGVEFEPDAAIWEQRFAELAAFKQSYGHCNAPKEWPTNPKLGRWLAFQRRFKARDQLSQARIMRLEALGVAWNRPDTAWEAKFGELRQYLEQEGHCDVPRGDRRHISLAKWVNSQRVRRKQGTLLASRFRRLNDLGFSWDTREDGWEQRFAELLTFKSERGHADVPTNERRWHGLGRWLVVQRRARKIGTLAEERIKRLADAGFTWDTRAANWDRHLLALQAFKAYAGHCNVPQAYCAEGLPLGKWVNGQRVARKQGTLDAHRISRLNTVGFQWCASRAFGK